MMSSLVKLAGPLIFAFDPETAHGLSITALKTGLPVGKCPRHDQRLNVTVAGLDFPNPLGMAAGYDKNGDVPDALLGLGFGFAEVGTVTPLPQSGNPKPRIFRLVRDGAVINRLGFNNEGHDAMLARLKARRANGIVGVNIGANKDSADRIADYELGVKTFAPVASYLTVNISSPNTPGLRALQDRAALADLLKRVLAARAASGHAPPIFLKIAPDLGEAELDDIAAELLDKKIDGLIVSNTTLSRAGASDAKIAAEAGGMSGAPLFARSTSVLARMRKKLGKDFVIIGVGGVDSAEKTIEKIRAGADLVQLYTGMIYAGPSLPGQIVSDLSRYIEREKLASIRDIRDSAVDKWAAAKIAG